MQITTLILHMICVILAVYIHRNYSGWRHFALMLLFSNTIGAIFYFLVLFENPYRHELSQFRSLVQAVILLAFGLGLARGK